MSVNSSSGSDSDPHTSSKNTSLFLDVTYVCQTYEPSSTISNVFNIINVLLFLPLCILILYHGLQEWQQKRFTSSGATMSHSDVFTYHMVIMEMIGVFGCILKSCGTYQDYRVTLIMYIVGELLRSFKWFGEIFFHILTGLEHYLAVIHPITYLNLRNERWIRIRNITILCVWLLCFAGMCLDMTENFFVLDFCLLTFSLIIISFCSLSVLSVLIRPGPGEQNRERVNQSKLRAFYTIVAILGVLVLQFVWGLVWAKMSMSQDKNLCVIMSFSFCFILPSSLVLPVLFIQRKEKLMYSQNNNQ